MGSTLIEVGKIRVLTEAPRNWQSDHRLKGQGQESWYHSPGR